MDDTWSIVHGERRALIEDLSPVLPERGNTPSLCDGWTIHDVLAHLVDDAKTTKASFVRTLVMAGFNFDRLNQKGVDRERRDSLAKTLEAFSLVSSRTTGAPAPLASRLVEIIVHGEDIRRPLGISHTYPTSAVIKAIEYQLATSGSMGGSKDRAVGLHIIATDTGWSHGAGEPVQGQAIDLLMALTGRLVPTGSLNGGGATILLDRRH